VLESLASSHKVQVRSLRGLLSCSSACLCRMHDTCLQQLWKGLFT
jgi:hypothetical protein